MKAEIQNFMSSLQTLGRALMLPIAVLPAAGILLRLGQPDVLDIAFMAAAGQSIFDNIGLLFAIGVAVGFAKSNDGAAGLAGVVCYLVTTFGIRMFIETPETLLIEIPETFHAISEQNYQDKIVARLSTPIGIVTGILSGFLFNRYSRIKLPEYLAFFGGRRFVPIAAAVTGMVLAAFIGLLIEPLNAGIEGLSAGVTDAGGIGLFIYGVLNRLFLVTGLHHILNNVAWFVVGDYQGATGDLSRFFAGDPSAGQFMSGFFPVMMFGLPAACLAMYRSVPKEKRRLMAGFYGSMALTSFLTGVTEPVEFAFMFQAPLLYAIHAALTGTAMVIMDLLNVKLGFGFSAGFIDYVINFNASTNPILLIPVGLVYGLIYYTIFAAAIRWMGLKFTEAIESGAPVTGSSSLDNISSNYVKALGGAQNLKSVNACTTRLRLEIFEPDSIDISALTQLGAKGIIQPTPGTMQIILGPQADQISQDINIVLAHSGEKKTSSGIYTKLLSIAHLSDQTVKLLGGQENIESVTLAAQRRLIIKLIKPKEGVALPGCLITEASNSSTHILHFVIEDIEKAELSLGHSLRANNK